MQKETAMGTSSQDVYDNAQRLIVCNSFTNIKNKYFKYNHLQDCDSIYKEIQQFFKNHENKEKYHMKLNICMYMCTHTNANRYTNVSTDIYKI